MSKPQLTIEVYSGYMRWIVESFTPSELPSRGRKYDWRWRIRHRNGRIMADSGESYRRKRDCLKAIATLKAGFAKAEVKEME